MADVKITALTENTTPLGTDIAPMVDDPGGTPLTQKITLTNLLATGAVANSVLAGTGTGVASYSAAPRLVNIADSGGTNVITTSTTSPQLTLLGADGDVQIGSGTGQSSLNLNTTFSAGNVAQILARGTYAVLSNILNVNISGLTISNAGTYTFTAIGGSAVPVIAAGSSATMQGLNFSAGASLSGVASDTTVVRITAARVIAGLFSSTRAGNVCTLMEGLEIGVPSLIGSTAGTVTTYVAANFLGIGSSNAARFSGSIYYGTKVILGLGTTGITGNRWGHNIADLSTGIASGKNVLGYSVDQFATAPAGGGVSYPFVYGTGASPIFGVNYLGVVSGQRIDNNIPLSGTPNAQGAGTALASSTTETVIHTAYTVNANLLVAGNMLRITAFGVYGTNAATTPTLDMRVRWGGVAGVLLGDSGANAMGLGVTNLGWKVEFLIRVVSIGATGTFECQGVFNADTTAVLANVSFMPNTAVVTVDTTANKDLVLTAQWGTNHANNTIQLREWMVEVLN